MSVYCCIKLDLFINIVLVVVVVVVAAAAAAAVKIIFTEFSFWNTVQRVHSPPPILTKVSTHTAQMSVLHSRPFKWSVLTKWALFILNSYHTLKYVGSRVGKCYATYLIFKDDIRVLQHSTHKKWHTILTVLRISLKNWMTSTCVFRVIILTA